jgi:hypothetical protein
MHLMVDDQARILLLLASGKERHRVRMGSLAVREPDCMPIPISGITDSSLLPAGVPGRVGRPSNGRLEP